MVWRNRLKRASWAWALLFLMLGGPAGAEECRGKDMLADLQISQPDRYRAIMAAASETKNSTAVLWRLEKDGHSPSWLLGTVHMSDARVAVPTTALTQALQAVQAIAVEVADMSTDAMVELMTKQPDLFVFRDGRTLSDVLKPDETKAVVEALARTGYPPNLAHLVRPWLAVTMLELPDCERMRSRDGQLVLDQRVGEEAKQRKLPVIGLETAGSQLTAMASIAEIQQVAMLKASLRYLDRSNDLGETLIQIYLKRQIGAAWPFQLALAAEAGIGPDAFNDFRDKLIVSRNREMVDKALALLADKSTLIAVGSLHLVGDEGLVELFRKAGYRVTAVE